MQCRGRENKRQKETDRETEKKTNIGHLKIFLIPYCFQDNIEMPLLKIGYDSFMFLLCFEELVITLL